MAMLGVDNTTHCLQRPADMQRTASITGKGMPGADMAAGACHQYQLATDSML
jgi:hypothetical protein